MKLSVFCCPCSSDEVTRGNGEAIRLWISSPPPSAAGQTNREPGTGAQPVSQGDVAGAQLALPSSNTPNHLHQSALNLLQHSLTVSYFIYSFVYLFRCSLVGTSQLLMYKMLLMVRLLLYYYYCCYWCCFYNNNNNNNDNTFVIINNNNNNNHRTHTIISISSFQVPFHYLTRYTLVPISKFN